MKLTKHPQTWSNFPIRSEKMLPLEQMELVKEEVFGGSREQFNIYVNQLDALYRKLNQLKQKSKKSDKSSRTQIASLKEENKKLKEENSLRVQQCQEMKQRLISVALMEKKSKDTEGLKKFVQMQIKVCKEQVRARQYSQEEWRQKTRDKSVGKGQVKRKERHAPKEIEILFQKELKNLARESIKQIKDAEIENTKMQEMKEILERELEFTKTMLMNVQGELKQRGDIMQRLVQALNTAETFTNYYYAGVSQDSQEYLLRRESVDSEMPRSYFLRPSSRPRLQLHNSEGRGGGLKATAKFLSQQSGKLEERFEKMKNSFSSQRSGISQQNLIEKIESSQQEVNNTLNETVNKIERTLSHIKVMQTPREQSQEEEYNMPLRRSVSPPKTLIDCNPLVSTRPPLFAVHNQEERKSGGELTRRSSHDNQYEKGASKKTELKSKELRQKKIRSFMMSTPQKLKSGPKKQHYAKSTFSESRRQALSPLERVRPFLKQDIQREERKPKSNFSLHLERIKSIDSTREYLEEEKKVLDIGIQSENVSPTSELMRKIKSKRIKSLAEDSVTQTITSLCLENNRLKEELEQLEERYQIEKGDFQRRLSAREHQGSKSVRILEEQIRYLNSQLESIQDQLSGISFQSPRIEVLQSGDNFDGLHSARILKQEAQSDKPETLYDFSELDEI